MKLPICNFNKIKSVVLLVLLSFWHLGTNGQIAMPAPSPTFEIKGPVGFSEVKVVYSRPSAKGRKVAGNLIPYHEVWRTGANASTKISFSEDVKLNGNAVPAGEYALYTIFTEETATIILSKNLSWWGALGYDPKEDQLRFDVPVKHPSSHYETFTISFSDFTSNSANLNLKWEHTKAMFSIESDVDGKVMKEIKAKLMDGTPENPVSYYYGASYYYDTDRDPELALQWIDKAITGSGEQKYWEFHLKAKIQAKNGDIKRALATAKKSMELARIGENMDYVRLNEKLIASLQQ
ncbi:DUF2911 domain-containing protein [Sediminicola sp. 1XM1-17]|uniref:DUF2911 domain-containing protein n=1 Tax=Sediminicola sp. 1XM1-17 TaxID=3127702 RepID=UPI003077F1C8